MWIGAIHGLAFYGDELDLVSALARKPGLLLTYGGPFSLAVMGILLSHEMGHYLTARRYHVDVTLPHFIPLPILSPVGTLCAFILLRSPIPNRRALLDIGLAGPFAGFAATLVAMAIGIATSRSEPVASADPTIQLGMPLLIRWWAEAFGPEVPAGQTLLMSPFALAAWFGALVTAVNLLPIGQLDGGHASYAMFRHGAHRISSVVFILLFPMAYFGPGWLFWALLTYLLGIHRPHSATPNDEEPLPRSRHLMGALGLVLLVLCFTPEPVVFSWAGVWEEITTAGGSMFEWIRESFPI